MDVPSPEALQGRRCEVQAGVWPKLQYQPVVLENLAQRHTEIAQYSLQLLDFRIRVLL